VLCAQGLPQAHTRAAAVRHTQGSARGAECGGVYLFQLLIFVCGLKYHQIQHHFVNYSIKKGTNTKRASFACCCEELSTRLNMSSATSKRAAITASPLEDSGILRQVFSNVGFGHWLFLVPVCKRWHVEYRALAEEMVNKSSFMGCDHNFCQEHARDCATLTFWRAAFASAECLQMATVSGLHLGEIEDADYAARCKLEPLLKKLGKYGSRDLLLHAHEQYSVPWSDSLCAGAAEAGDISKLQWLHIEQRCPLYEGYDEMKHIAVCAEQSDNGVAMLRWLKEVGVALPNYVLAMHATVHARLCTLQCLRRVHIRQRGPVSECSAQPSLARAEMAARAQRSPHLQ
jgi:hypothetical protein